MGAKINVMSLKLELERVIEAAKAAIKADQHNKDTGYARTPRQEFRNSMYDLKKAVQHAETELKKKQTELFT